LRDGVEDVDVLALVQGGYDLHAPPVGGRVDKIVVFSLLFGTVVDKHLLWFCQLGARLCFHLALSAKVGDHFGVAQQFETFG
jgi:hypothetical protein